MSNEGRVPERTRVVLWNGKPEADVRLGLCLNELAFETFTHCNFFHLMKMLKKNLMQTVKKFDLTVHGLTTNENIACWPLTPRYRMAVQLTEEQLRDEEWKINKESETYKDEGLALIPTLSDNAWRASLYLLSTVPPIREIKEKRRYLVGLKHRNLFMAAEQIKNRVLEREEKRGATGVKLAELDDKSPCWPTGL